jgi:hypothetical protein
MTTRRFAGNGPPRAVDYDSNWDRNVVSAEDASHFAGGCACGAVRYQCTGAAVAMVNCHCRDCQRAGGTGYSPTVVVARANFRLCAEPPKYHEVISESGNTATRAFCRHCGSPLFAFSSARIEFIGIRAGSLDDPSWFRPTADVWVASGQPWDLLHPDTKNYAQGRT